MQVSKYQTSEILNNISFIDIFNLEEVQHLQNLFSDVTGVASIITHPDGTPITRPSNFTRLCGNIISNTEKRDSNCFQSDSVADRQNPSGPVVQHCMSGGLWDAGESITVGGKHIANWLIGQMRNEELDEQQMIQYAGEIDANREDFRKALNEVPVMSVDQFNKVSEMLFSFVSELSEKAYNNLQMKMQIYELERTTELLRKNEERYRMLFEHSIDTILLVDASTGNILDANRAAEIMTGRSRKELKSLKTFDISLKGATKRLEIFLHSNEPLDMGEVKCLRTDGSMRTALLNTIPLSNSRVFGIAHDITERRQAEFALKASEERYRTIIQTSMDGFWLLDMQGHLLEVNETYCRMSGYSEQELLGMRISDLKITQAAVDSFSLVRTIMENGENCYETLHRRKDGSVFNLEARVQYLPNYGGRLVVFLHDITKRKQAEESLRRSRAIQDKMTANIDDVILIIDQNKKVQYISHNIEKRTGWKQKEVIDGVFGSKLHPDDIDNYQKFYSALMCEANAVGTIEYRYRCKDGSYIWAEATAVNLFHDPDISGI